MSRIADQQSDGVETSVKVVMQRASDDRELGALGNVASARAERHAQCAEKRVRFFLDKVELPLLHQLHLDRESRRVSLGSECTFIGVPITLLVSAEFIIELC